MTEIPYVGDLLRGSPSNWGRWGPDDEVGALNHLTSAEVLRAAAEIRTGEVFTLQRLIGDERGDPIWPGRAPAARTQMRDESHWDAGDPGIPGGCHAADDRIEMHLQGTTQCDALGHVWYDGLLYNGYDARSTIGGLDRASVEPLARRGIVGRGVLLDLARFRGAERLGFGAAVTLDELLECAKSQRVTIEPRDVVVLRTNFLSLFHEDQEAFARGMREHGEPGLSYSPELARWFADMEIPSLVTDTMANEVTRDPGSSAVLLLHSALMRNLGVVFTEMCDLEAVAARCATNARFTFCYVAAPLRIARATGSPVNPVVIR
ncbi:cyclase family protein [Nonomuraea wenchangensis]